MKITHPILSAPIECKENKIPIVVLESTLLFRQWVFMLTMQSQGKEGDFILSDGLCEILECERHLFVIRDYYDLSLENRVFQNKFQSMLQYIVREELACESDEFNRAVQKYLQQVIMAVDYPITYSEGEYSISFLKSIKFQPCIDGDTLLERLLQYLQIIQWVIPKPCFVLVSPHIYFSDDELAELYRMASYNKYKLLILENQTFTKISIEEYYIIDEQMCELRIDLSDKLF